MSVYYLILYGTGFLILYSYRAFHRVSARWSSRRKIIGRTLFLTIAILIYASTSYLASHRDDYRDNQFIRNYTVGGAVTLSVTLAVISLFQLMSDVLTFFLWLGRRISNSAAERNPSRRTFLSKVALGAGALVFGSFLWGTTRGKFGWRIEKNRLAFKNLPSAFDGLKVVQISDLHLGSFDNNFEPLQEAVEMINELDADYIFFTGDLVNESPEEAEGWIEIFKGLKASSGKFAILGNHDYGWGRTTEEEKTENSRGVLEILKRMDFDVLANEHRMLRRGQESICLVGVENWGWSEQGWFPMRGDYDKAVSTLTEQEFTILLSHDPTHWDRQIVGKRRAELTLSGHTHGGQVGIRIPGLAELSAGRFFYERFAGAYQEGDQHLYVNRGMGYLIFPGRVGMPPEITLHHLSKA